MFKKIRRNFIIVSMSSVSLILLISIGIINIVNYHNVDTSSDSIIQEIYKKLEPTPPKPSNEPPKPGEIGDNSYFVAIYENDSFSISDDNFKMRAINKDEAINIAVTVKNTGKTVGYYNYYRYNVIDNKYIFLDATNKKDSAKHFLLVSIYSSLGGLTAFFLLIFFASKRVLKPVQESYAKQKQFITNASHELKTPVTVISANNELLEMKCKKNEYTENISVEVKKLNKLIKDLISFSKMSENKKIVKEKINFSKILEDITNNYKLVCEDVKLTLKCDIEKDIVATANKDVLSQMVNIILDNARKYAHKAINISLKKNSKSIILYESNDTNGIDDGDLSYFTERFYRSENTRNSGDGSGIGLSVLKELCALTRSKLKIYGKNNRFNIEVVFTYKN